MIAKYFKFENEENAWIGLAIAKDKKELFWTIEQHGDPNRCQLKDVGRHASVCFLIIDDVLLDDEGVEIGEGFDKAMFDYAWKPADWSDIDPYKEDEND